MIRLTIVALLALLGAAAVAWLPGEIAVVAGAGAGMLVMLAACVGK